MTLWQFNGLNIWEEFRIWGNGTTTVVSVVSNAAQGGPKKGKDQNSMTCFCHTQHTQNLDLLMLLLNSLALPNFILWDAKGEPTVGSAKQQRRQVCV